MSSFTETALQTKEAKEAIGEGVLEWLSTGNLDEGVDAMFKALVKITARLTQLKLVFSWMF